MTVPLSHVSMVYALMVLTPSPAGVMKDMKDSFVRLVSQRLHIPAFIIAYVLLSCVYYHTILCILLDTDDCSPHPCNYGNCTDEVDGFSCSCYDGYDGETCDNSE